jgi:hypothetical protein
MRRTAISKEVRQRTSRVTYLEVMWALSGRDEPLRGPSVRPVGLELTGFNQTEGLNRLLLSRG